MKVPFEVEIFDDYEFCEDADNHCQHIDMDEAKK